MKKKNLFLVAFAIVAMMTSCEKEEVEPIEEGQVHSMTITAEVDDVESFTDTKTSISGRIFTWVEGDALSIYAKSGSKQTFALTGGATTNQADFKGKLTSVGELVYAAYTSDADATFTTSAYTSKFVMSQTQKHTSSIAFNPQSIGMYALMFGKSAVEVTTVLADTTPVNISMEYLTSILDFKLIDIPEGTVIKSLQLKASSDIFPSLVSMDLSNYTRSFSVKENLMTVALIGVDGKSGVIIDSDKMLTIRLAMLPTTVPSGGKLTIELDIVGTEVGQEKRVLTQEFSDEKHYMAGKVHNIDLDYATFKTTSIHIPKIYINVKDQVEVTTKNYYDAVVRIEGGNRYEDLAEVSTRIKGRGNSTWGWPKKPYKLKLDKKASLLGLDEEKDWVLLANHIDPSLMINSMAMKAGALIGVSYVNTMIPVDVIINGKHRGSYVLTEQVEVKKARVNLSDDGYLLELDANYDEDFQFKSPIIDLPVMVKGTELDLDITANFDAIKNEFIALEAEIMSDDFPENGYEDLIDLETVASFLLVNELTMNFEITVHPKSVFIYKDKGAKFGMGPIWDFDWTCGYEGSWEHFVGYESDIFASTGKGATFFNRFFLDPKFVTIYKRKWNDFHDNDKVAFFKYMDDYADLLLVSANHNFTLWPEPNKRSFVVEVERMENWFRKRIEYLDRRINNLSQGSED